MRAGPHRTPGLRRRMTAGLLGIPILALAGLWPGAAEAGRRVIIADGTADPKTQAVAAAMALLPVVAVVVFALVRLIDPPGR